MKVERNMSKDSRHSRHSRHSVVKKAQEFIVKHKVDPLAFTVMFFGAMLASCAGMTNAVAFHALGAFVSHVTGTLSKVGLHAQADSMSDAGDSLLLVVSFALGSAACGCMITRNTVSFGFALYGMALLVNASLLVVAILTATHKAAPYILAAACGLQNGMATSYSGAVIRTTHVTGLCTDIGLIIGRNSNAFIRKHFWHKTDTEDHTADCRKLLLLFVLGFSFLGGVFLGAVLHKSWGVNALILPACLTGTSGAAYTVYRTCWLHQPLMTSTESEAKAGADDWIEPRHSSRKSSTASASMEDGLGFYCGEESSKVQGALQPPADEELKVENASAPGGADGQPPTDKSDESSAPLPVGTPRRTSTEKVPVERLLEMVDALEPSLAELPPLSMPGAPDLQAEAMDAHRRLRSALTEMNASSPEARCSRGATSTIA